MAITVPAAGDPVTAAWGSSVATLLNQFIPLIVTSDVSKTGSTYTDITGLTFAATAGKSYSIRLVLAYDCAGTSTGLSVAFNHGGGTARAYVEIHGVTSAATHTDEHLNATDTATGTTAVNAAGTIYMIDWIGTYVCTVSGTFALRYARNGTSTTVTIHAGSGGTVVTSA